MNEVQSNLVVGAALGGGRTTGVVGNSATVVRPRLVLRLAGPVLVAVGLAVASAVGVAGVPITLIGLGACALWWPRIHVDGSNLVVRGMRGSRIIPLQSIEEIKLRRIPFGPARPPHRTYRFGRLSTTPIRLRVISREEYVAEVTVVWWSHWQELVQVLLELPGVVTDSRTRGRLERYS